MTSMTLKNASLFAERAEILADGRIQLFGVRIEFLPGTLHPLVIQGAPEAGTVPLPITDQEASDTDETDHLEDGVSEEGVSEEDTEQDYEAMDVDYDY